MCGSAATGDTAIVRCRAHRAHGKELYTLHDRDRIGSFWGRLETSMLKLAALHQLGLLAAHQDSNAATEDAVIVIDPEALDLAIALVEHLKRGLVVLFGRNWRPAALLKAKQKMLAVVRHAGGSISQRELQRRSANLLTKDFHSVLGGL